MTFIIKTFIKILSANDVGTTGGHQAGIVVPKGDGELLAFLPKLDAAILNPSTWIDCETPSGQFLRLRFVYYNNRIHVPNGTRNEYRITHLTKFLREAQATPGDTFEISRTDGLDFYKIRVLKICSGPEKAEDVGSIKIKLTTGWRRVH